MDRKELSQKEKEERDLKKRTRLLNNDHQKYSQEAKASMLKQSDTIHALKKENEKLKQELATTSGTAFNASVQDKIQHLSEDSESLERKIHYEKVRQADLDKKLTMARMDQLQSRQCMGGVNVTTENHQNIEKQVKVLENRLDQALVKFNEALSYNKDLREQIQNLRSERDVFDIIYKKLENELHLKKKMMADIIEKSNKDYEERDAQNAQLEALKLASKEDGKKYDEHFTALDQMMQQYKIAREQQMQQQQQQTKKSTVTKQDEPERKAQKSAKPAADGKVHSVDDLEETGQEQEQELQEIVDSLKEATGIQDLEVLYSKFVKAEEHNFSMYNFVNELNAEVETLELEINQLKSQQIAEKGDIQRRKALKSLEDELALTESQTESLNDRTQHLKEQLDTLRVVIQEIFTKIGCSPEMAAEQLGTTECTESSMLAFLGIIEHRTNEIMMAYNLAQANEVKRKALNKDEEARRRRERRAADRQARIEAGEQVPDEEEYEDDYEDKDNTTASTDTSRAKFVGVGPAVPHGYTNPLAIVMQHGLPNTNAGDAASGDDDNVDENEVYNHDALRLQMEQRLLAKREQDKGPVKPGGGKQKPRKK